MHSAAGLLTDNCEYPKVILGLMVMHYSFMFILFLDFYKKAYSRKTQ
jgi:hypothetical protein